MTLCKKSGCLIAAAVAIGMSCRLVAGSMDAFNQQLQVQSAQIVGQAIAEDCERQKAALRHRKKTIWGVALNNPIANEVCVCEEPLNSFWLKGSWYKLGKLFITSERLAVAYDANTDDDEVVRLRWFEHPIALIREVYSKRMIDGNDGWLLRKLGRTYQFAIVKAIEEESLPDWFCGKKDNKSLFCDVLKVRDLTEKDLKSFVERAWKMWDDAKEAQEKQRQDELAAREKERQAALARQRLEAQKKSDSATKQIGKPKVSTPKKDKSAGWSLGSVLGWGLVAVSFVVIVYLVNRIRTMRNSGISESQMNASKKDARLKLTWVKCVFRCVAQAWKKFWKKRVEGVDAMPNGVEYFIVSVFLLALYVGWVALIDFQVRVAFECIPFARGIYRLINAILGNFKMKLLVDELMFGLLFSLVVCEIIFAAPIVFLMGRIVRFNFRRLKVANRNRTQIVAFVILLLIMSAMPLLRLVDFCVYFGFVMASIFNWSLREGGCPYSYEALGVVFCCVCCGVWIIRLCRRVENG